MHLLTGVLGDTLLIDICVPVHQDGEIGAWGSRASVDLLKVKGKGFTREKNKKKRGSYRGGAIDQHVSHSFKFED